MRGLWLATGHHRNGVLLAAITARMVAKALCSGAQDTEVANRLQLFRWDRFGLAAQPAAVKPAALQPAAAASLAQPTVDPKT